MLMQLLLGKRRRAARASHAQPARRLRAQQMRECVIEHLHAGQKLYQSEKEIAVLRKALNPGDDELVV